MTNEKLQILDAFYVPIPEFRTQPLKTLAELKKIV